MSSSNNKIGVGGKTNQPTPSTMSSSNPSLLLSKFNERRSTPDSEALASSDDEAERQDVQQPVNPPSKPTRRASWLNDTTPSGTQPRKGSFASSTMSPTTSHPTTPSTESNAWSTHSQVAGRGHTSPGSFAWGSGIWNTESRKEPPSRLTEVLPSPTSIHPPGSAGNGYFPNEMMNQRDPSVNPSLPFAIPLHPTPKTYRSQSYSVGQLDPDISAGPPPATVTAAAGRVRGIGHSALQHRPSRPSMLSEITEGGLGNVKEVEDDDDESTNSSSHGVQIQSQESKTIELLARENAMLRQQQNQYQSLRLRPRSSTSNAFGLGNGYGLQEEPLPEESDYAIDELDELQGPSKVLLGRRMSEFGIGGAQRVSPYTLENRKLENVKKAYWQSSLGFGGMSDLPQSRRHSFADIPARQGSVSSAVGEPLSQLESSIQETARYNDGNGYSFNDHGKQFPFIS